MKLLMLNGSPKANGNTALALTEMEKIFVQEGIYRIYGDGKVYGCL